MKCTVPLGFLKISKEHGYLEENESNCVDTVFSNYPFTFSIHVHSKSKPGFIKYTIITKMQIKLYRFVLDANSPVMLKWLQG